MQFNSASKGFIGETINSDPIDPSEFIQQPGLEWTLQSSPNFRVVSVAFGNGIFVAVGVTAPYVMTSPDGINWTAGTAASGNPWRMVVYGGGLFVAVSDGGPLATRYMTSPDGFTWTSRPQPANTVCQSLCYGNGLFVVVGYNAVVPSERVFTSTDGITWTTRNVPANGYVGWSRVTYGAGLFVACSGSLDSLAKIMTSPDGINWTVQTIPPSDNQWEGIAYGNGIYVCVCISGAAPRLMTSTDGITWTRRPSADDNLRWWNIIYAAGLFVCTANNISGDGNTMLIQTSPDGINWTLRDSKFVGGWVGAAYGNGMFVITDAANPSPSGQRIATSGQQQNISVSTNNKQVGGRTIYGGLQVETSETKLATVGGRIQQFFTSQGNIGNVATDIYSYSIPANMLNANGQSIEAEYYGTFSSNASAEKTLQLEIVGNLILSKNPASLSTETPWEIKVTLTRVSNTVIRVGYHYSDTSADPDIIGYADVAGLNLTTTASIMKLVGISDDPGAADNDIQAVLANLYWFPAAV